MKRGRKHWTSKITNSLKGRIIEAIRAGEPVDAVWRKLRLSRFTTLRSYRTYHVVIHRDWEARREDSEPLRTISDVDALIESSVTTLQTSLDAGKMPDKKLPEVMHALAAIKKLQFAQDVNKRAAELHEKRLKNLEPGIKAAIAAPTTPGARDLRTILESVAAGAIAIDEAVKQVGDVLWIEIDKQMRGA